MTEEVIGSVQLDRMPTPDQHVCMDEQIVTKPLANHYYENNL